MRVLKAIHDMYKAVSHHFHAFDAHFLPSLDSIALSQASHRLCVCTGLAMEDVYLKNRYNKTRIATRAL